MRNSHCTVCTLTGQTMHVMDNTCIIFVTAFLGGKILKVSGSENCKHLYMALCDLCTTVQAIGRLADHFTGNFFTSRLSDTQTLFAK